MAKKEERIKQYIFHALGGNSAVARLCGVNPAATSQWKAVPAERYKVILDAAAKLGYAWDINIFYTMPPKKADWKAPA